MRCLQEAFLLLSSLGAVRALRSPNAVVSQLLLRVADRLEKASCSPEAATRPLCHPVRNALPLPAFL